MSDDLDKLCEDIAGKATQRRIGVAESLSGGNIAARLSRAPSSGDWFSGGIIAYRPEVKHHLLQVPDGPVVCAAAAEAMATSSARLLEADLVVAVTGEAGPQSQEDDPGTVWFGIFDGGEVTSSCRLFDGEPAEIVTATITFALTLLHERLQS
ncbi:MAG: CinA family protein [Actinomycetota bacterium]|nr:CinA family protein [Actinomycetota bacterium]